ncbi:MAG: hypothetical protein ACTSPX_03705, partial [Candidatus Thorarchaeota archaeon]
PAGASEQDLRHALHLLQEHEERLAALSDDEWVDQAFVAAIGHEYAPLLSDHKDVDALKTYILRQTGSDVSGWDRATVRAITRKWIAKFYEERFYSEVIDMVRTMSEASVKELLLELAGDPAVGMRLLEQRRQTA